MSKIRILPEQLANQIAAGEVVERPASVVKELVENSLDAKATRVEIEIEGGGTKLIRIIDNGIGMEEDDLLLSLERHGTSKIKTEDDLGAISTLGFRGEAIPSIGSVSKLSLTSRVKDAELGTRVVLEYGKLTKVHEIGCSYGTTVEVRSLFGNTPARRKFLRTTRTELGHIEEIVKNYALGCPEIAFTLSVNGRKSLYLDSTMSIMQRLKSIMRYDGPLISISSNQQGHFSRELSGFLLPPEKVTQGPAKLRIFVNGRTVRDRMIIHGVTEGLRGFLMKGKNPSGLIHLQVSPEEIDVNVHPAKHEIRFRNSREVHTFLSQGVAEAMLDHQQYLKASIFGGELQPSRIPIPIDPLSEPQTSKSFVSDSTHQTATAPFSKPLANDQWPEKQLQPEQGNREGIFSSNIAMDSPTCTPAKIRNNTPTRVKSKQATPSQPLFNTAEPIAKHDRPESAIVTSPENHTATDTEIRKTIQSTPQDQVLTQPQTQHHNLLIIGQFDDLYIFCKNSDGLLVIDQHAAHERLLYEKLRKQYLDNRVVKQTLMFPETIELSLFQSQLVEKNLDELERMGFSLRDFGGNTFIISAVPALGGSNNSTELFLNILDQFGNEANNSNLSPGGGILDNILATMACKAAVKAGTNLSKQEMEKLLDDMAQADLFSHCPHGRPVVKQFSNEDVKKWFYRT